MPTLELWPLNDGAVAVPGDVHVPVHDLDALHAWLEHHDRAGTGTCVILGDFLDCKALGSHAKPPRETTYTIDEEAERANYALAIFCAVFREVIYLPGNHESRVDYLQEREPSLAGLQWWEILQLKERRNLTFLGIGDDIRFGKARLVHGDTLKGSMSAGGPATVLRNNPFEVTIYGHSHRLGAAYHTIYGRYGREHVYAAFNVGHLSDLTQQTYAVRPNWQLGGATLRMLDDCGSVSVKLDAVVRASDRLVVV